MKPAPFAYERPRTLDDALGLIAQPGAKLLAGGQSLIPLLNLRLARPTTLIDIGRIEGLSDIVRDENGDLHIGALVRHQQLLGDPLVAKEQPLLSKAVVHVGHVAIRNRGTLGGSLCHADPTAELAMALLTLDSRFRLVSRMGSRWVSAAGFFVGPFNTACRDDEVLVEVVVPPKGPGQGSSFVELSPRPGDFAIVAAAVALHLEGRRLGGIRIGWSGGSDAPMLASGLAQDLAGQEADGTKLEGLCQDSVQSLRPSGDIRGTSQFKRAALAHLTSLALREAIAAARVSN